MRLTAALLALFTISRSGDRQHENHEKSKTEKSKQVNGKSKYKQVQLIEQQQHLQTNSGTKVTTEKESER